ncbi:MAG: S-layer homology domain-containing protein [Firmicutes bacterium]|nr:S-layer homology domain-containing protein [Bacillota bacterium]
MKKKLLSIITAAALTAGIIPCVTAAAPTRAEALISIIQTIGKETEALNSAAENPFDDVSGDAEKYVAYAYQNGIVSGVDANTFEPNREVTAEEYSIMLERARSLAASSDDIADEQSENVLSIAEQGIFSSGGTVTEPVEGEFDSTANWLDFTRAGNTAHVDHANVLYQIPEDETELPMVFLHGYGQSRMGWMTTPDGREGWSNFFLKAGHSVFLVDQPRRGEAGSTASMTTDAIDTWSEDSKDYMPGDQAWYTHFRIGRGTSDRYEGSQFPEGEDALDQFLRQITPNTGSFDQEVIVAAMDEVMSDVREKTGQKSIYVTHSQGGAIGWYVNTENVAAIVAIEPGGTPEIGSEQYNNLLAADIPIVIYFGDYIDNGPEDIVSTSFWKGVKDAAEEFAQSYNADGGSCTVVSLPDIGITGNSHFMFQELNSDEIAAHVEMWIDENVNQ